MKKKIIYTKAPTKISEAIKSSLIIKDFLPTPENLITKDDTVRITINLSKPSISFFKKEGKRLGVPYQRMIKSLIDLYAEKFS